MAPVAVQAAVEMAGQAAARTRDSLPEQGLRARGPPVRQVPWVTRLAGQAEAGQMRSGVRQPEQAARTAVRAVRALRGQSTGRRMPVVAVVPAPQAVALAGLEAVARVPRQRLGLPEPSTPAEAEAVADRPAFTTLAAQAVPAS